MRNGDDFCVPTAGRTLEVSGIKTTMETFWKLFRQFHSGARYPTFNGRILGSPSLLRKYHIVTVDDMFC